jgi:hypothetical protein
VKQDSDAITKFFSGAIFSEHGIDLAGGKVSYEVAVEIAVNGLVVVTIGVHTKLLSSNIR